MSNTYDVIIIGAGHNGLTAAAYLTKAGKKVLVLERRSIVGGSVVTEEFGDRLQGGRSLDRWELASGNRPGVSNSPRTDFSLTRPADRISPSSLILPASASIPIPLRPPTSIRRFSEKDAARWPEFVAFMHKSASFLDTAYATIMPRLPKEFTWSEGYGLAEMGLDLRLMGREDMLNLIRLLPDDSDRIRRRMV